MPWTVSRTTSSGAGIILITPDNADLGANWDMQSALDAAISQGLAGISKVGLNSYLADSNTGIRVEGFSGQTGFLFFSGITLECRNRFFLGDNSRIKFQIKNSNNIRQARPLLIINFFPVGYFDGEGAFSIGQNVVLHTNGFDFSYRGTGGSNTYSDGAIIDAGWRNNGSAIIKNSTFASDASNGSNAIYFLNNNAQFEDVKLVGLVLEIAKPGIFKGFTATECSKTKTYGINGGSGFYVFEDWTWIDCDEDFVFQRQSQTIFIDCAIDLNNLSDDIGGGGFGLFKNSIELQGGSSFANGNFYLQDPTAFDSYSRSFNSSGRIEGGNAEGTSIAVNSDRICATVHRISKGQSTASDFDRSGIWAGIAVKYGREPVPISLTLNGLKSGKQLVPFASASDSQITQSNAATVATYTGFAVNYSTQLVTRSSGTEAQLYDWLALEKSNLTSSGVVVNGLTLPKCALPTLDTKIYDRTSGEFAYNLRIVGSDFTTGSHTIAMASGRTLTFAIAADHSAVRISIPSTGIVHFEQGGTATLAGTFAAGATINNGSASALTVLADYDQIANIATTSTGGGSISVRSAPVTFTGFPTAANANGRMPDATFGVQDVSSGTWHTYDASSGSVSVSLSELATAPAYQLIVRGDAIGWIRTPDSTIDADYSGTFNFANLFREIVDEDGDAMVGLGTQSVMDKITYNQSAGRFEIDSGAIDFFSALDKKEVLTSSQSGLTVFDSALVRQLNFIKNAYANLIQFPSPLTAAASATAATSPILTDFVVTRTGDPTADVFVHGLPSTAPGLSDRPEIRMGITKFISSSASGGSGGSGATAVEIRQEMDANSTKLAAIVTQTNKLTFTNTGRVDATAITIANNAITAASIATDAITSSGLAASAVIEIQSGLATQSSVSAIPTNPLLASDTRLNNLNAPIGSIPTNPLLTSDVRLNNLNAPVGSIPTNPLLTNDARLDNLDAAVSSRLASTGYTAPDNAGVSSLNTKLTMTRAGNLDNLDAAISSRSTASDIPNTNAIADAVDLILLDSFAEILAAIPAAPDNSGISTLLSRLTSPRASNLDNLNATISSRAVAADLAVTVSGGFLADDRTKLFSLANAPDATAVATAVDTALSDNFAGILGALPPPPDNDGIAAIKLKTDNLPSSPASTSDVQVTVSGGFLESDRDALQAIPTLTEIEASTTLAKSSQIPPAPNNDGIAAIKAKTDVIVVTSGRVAASIDDTLLAKQATVETVSTHTARVNALIEDNGGDRFTVKALEAAPTGEGGGSGLTAEEIWTHEPRTITARPPGTASDTDVAAIKAKTDNLPASPASTDDVQVQVTVDGGFTTDDRTALEAIPSADENADAVRAELAVELGRINATIGSRATPTDVQVTVSGGFTTGDRTTITTIATQVDQLHELEGIDDPTSAKDPTADVPGYRRSATIRQTLTQNSDGSYTIAPEPPP